MANINIRTAVEGNMAQLRPFCTTLSPTPEATKPFIIKTRMTPPIHPWYHPKQTAATRLGIISFPSLHIIIM
ncbi:hypothetical protein VTJ04DRAFT_4235 [Mycothermus thermophilus]|uniref:uncharacterized protein n=1 Tax=Humicola insolens TaxID=85995 RepID=UPI003742F448